MMHAVKYPYIEEQVLELSEHSAPGALYLNLRQLSRNLLHEGVPKDVLVDALEDVRRILREENQEDAEDTVLEVMDDLVGWCPPGSAIH